MKKKISLAAIALSLSGCTLVPCDHTFPKLDWYWSAAAINCRLEHKMEKQFDEQSKTNQPPVPQ